MICSEGGEVELGLVEGTEEGGRGKPCGAPWTDIFAAHEEC